MDVRLKGRWTSLITFSPVSLWLNFPDPDEPEASPTLDYNLRIDGPFRLVSGDAIVEIHPADGPNAACLGLLQRVVETAVAADDGSFAISFDDEDRLEIPGDSHEPWQLTGNGQTLVSVAGGGLAVFREDLGVDTDESRLERLVRAGLATRGMAPPPIELIAKPGPALPPGVSLVDALLEERREGW